MMKSVNMSVKLEVILWLMVSDGSFIVSDE